MLNTAQVAILAPIAGVFTSLTIKGIDVLLERKKASITTTVEDRKQGLVEWQAILNEIKEDYKRLDGELKLERDLRQKEKEQFSQEKKELETSMNVLEEELKSHKRKTSTHSQGIINNG